jgi:predicted dehydrogenase
MQEAASANGVVFMPGDNFVHRPPFDEAKSLLQRGALGRISYAMFSTSHFLPGSMIQGWRRSVHDTGGGALMDSGSHLIHEMLYLLGKPQQLCGSTSRVFYEDFEGEDVAVVTLRYPSGALVHVFQGWASADHSPTPEVKILGTDGALWISDALYLQQWGDDYQHAEFLTPAPPAQKLSANVSYQESFKYQMDYFCRCITEGATPRPTGQDSEVMLAIVHGAYASDKEHRMIQL